MRLAPTLLVLALLGGIPAPARSAEAPAPASNAVSQAAGSGISPERLKDDLPQVPSIVIDGDQVLWKDGQGHAVTFAKVAVGRDNPSLDTEIGPLPIDRRLVAENRTEVIAQVERLIALAKAANLTAEGFLLREGHLTGIHLRSDQKLVLADGVVSAETPTPVDHASELAALREAVTAGLAILPKTRLDPPGQRAVGDALRLIDGQDLTGGVGDELQPSLVRRAVNHGWLDRILPDQAEARQLRAALAKASAFTPVRRYRGGGVELAEVRNAFGDGGWTLTSSSRSALARPAVATIYGQLPDGLQLVVELPAGSDPLAWPAGANPTSARLYGNVGQGLVRLATWSQSTGFAADPGADGASRWRQVVEVRPGKDGVGPVPDYLPPHLFLAGLSGDSFGLAATDDRGQPFLLRSPTGETADSKRFLDEAFAHLRTPALLDLVGQYFMAYIYDSPDSRFPELIGNKQVKGDIHQTAVQTLATAAGGLCRGDCDDLAELYQRIRNGEREPGENRASPSIVLTLPGHLAAAWAEKRDGVYHVYVLQTGPALEFTATTLQEALRKAYAHFGAAQTFDPNGLGLALRFNGENTRSTEWRLSYRIFEDPDYAQKMVDVQKDWYFQTYQRGIDTMRGMIAAGDTDNANYRELAGLFTITGQHGPAVDFHQQAIAGTPEVESRFLLRTELLGMLFEAKRTDEAKALAKQLIETELPAVRAGLRDSVVTAGMQLAGVLNGNGCQDLALQAVEATALDPLTKQIEGLCFYVRSPKFDATAWAADPRLMELRQVAASFAGLGMGLVKEASPGAIANDVRLQRIARATQQWLDELAFRDLDDDDDAPGRYANVARWYAAVLGEERFNALVDQAPMPTTEQAPGQAKARDHANRVGGLAQLSIDLPWIKASPSYWSGRMGALVVKDKTTLDQAALERCWTNYQTARDACLKMGMDSPSLETGQHLAALMHGILVQDLAVVHERLKWVQEKGDRRLRNASAELFGDLARFVPLEKYGSLLDAYGSDLKPGFSKPNWFLIAWRAKIHDAPQHALLAAKQATDRYQDPAFAEEYEFMRQLLEKPAGTATAATSATTAPAR